MHACDEGAKMADKHQNLSYQNLLAASLSEHRSQVAPVIHLACHQWWDDPSKSEDKKKKSLYHKLASYQRDITLVMPSFCTSSSLIAQFSIMCFLRFCNLSLRKKNIQRTLANESEDSIFPANQKAKAKCTSSRAWHRMHVLVYCLHCVLK